MECITRVDFSSAIVKKVQTVASRSTICSISCKNLVAFSAPRCYKTCVQKDKNNSPDDVRRDGVGTGSKAGSNCDFGGLSDTVFVCPLLSPWNAHVIVTMEYEIKHIAWDSSGTKVLLADASGLMFLWQMQESIINKWIWTNFTKSLGDDICCLHWTNSALTYSIAKDAREKNLYEERFPLSHTKPTLNLYGGKCLDLWIAVTSSGAACVGLIQPKQEMLVFKKSLQFYENSTVISADIDIDSQGDVFILSSSGSVQDPVRVYKLLVKTFSRGFNMQVDSCDMECEVHSSFFLEKCKQAKKVSLVKYASNSRCAYVCVERETGCEVQLWNLCEEMVNLHSEFQSCIPSPEKTWRWVRQSSLNLPGCVTAISTSPLLSENNVLFSQAFALACSDGTLRYAYRNSLNEMQTLQCLNSNSGERVCAMSYSPNGCVVVAITNRCSLLMFGEEHMHLDKATLLLEYSAYCGVDWDDVLTCINKELSDKLLHNLAYDCAQQNRGVEQQLMARSHALKIGLSLCTPSNSSIHSSTVGDLLAAAQLFHVHTQFMAAISCKQYDDMDLSSEDCLHDKMGTKSCDLDSIASQLVPVNDFLPEDGSASSLQPMVQWVCELAVHLLTSLPMYAFAATGAWLVRDVQSLMLIREMLVLTKLWSSLVPKCRPSFSCSMSTDMMLAKLFGGLTVLLLSVQEGGPLPDSLLDECHQLSTYLVIPPFEKSFCWSKFPKSLLGKQEKSKHLFGDEQTLMPCLQLPLGQHITQLKKDIFTHIAIGNQVSDKFKKCVRCHGMTTVTRSATEPKNKLTVPHYCVCGGMWTLLTQRVLLPNS